MVFTVNELMVGCFINSFSHFLLLTQASHNYFVKPVISKFLLFRFEMKFINVPIKPKFLEIADKTQFDTSAIKT